MGNSVRTPSQNASSRRRNLTIRSRLVLVTGLLIGAIATFIFYYFPSRLEDQALASSTTKARTIAEMTAYNVAPGLFLGDSLTVEEGSAIARQNEDVAFLVVRHANGTLVSAFNQHLAPDSLFERSAYGELTPDGMLCRVTEEIAFEGDVVGQLSLGLSLEKLRAQINRSRTAIGLVSLAIFSVGLLAVIASSLVITRPLGAIVSAAERISRGNLSERAEVISGDEVGDLAESFNRMVESLQEAHGQLAEVNRHLEERVEARTADLQSEIDQHKLTEASRQTLAEQLLQSQKMEAVGQLTAGIAHNFNNMLQVVAGNLELASANADDENQPHLAAALASTLEAAGMIQELMLFSRHAPAERNELDVHTVIDEVAAICRRTFDRRIDLVVHRRGDAIVVLGNPGQLRQVFLNLCLNARDAVDGHGGNPRIEIDISSIDGASQDFASAPGFRPGPHARISVTDNGVGMTEETRARVFEPFFTTKMVGEGTGLGLATVYAIVRDHESWLECSSEPEVGTSFAVYLPLVEAGEAVEAETAHPRLTEKGSETILVIDDEELVRDVMRQMLEGSGYTVLLGVDGDDGLEVFRRHREDISLVVLDLSMPNRSGAEVLADLTVTAPEIPVLVATGRIDLADGLPGATAVVGKPFEMDVLTAAVREGLAAADNRKKGVLS